MHSTGWDRDCELNPKLSTNILENKVLKWVVSCVMLPIPRAKIPNET